MSAVKRKNAAAIVFAGKDVGVAFFPGIDSFGFCLRSFGGFGLEVPGGYPLVVGFAEAAFAQVFFKVGHVGGAVEDGDVAFL